MAPSSVSAVSEASSVDSLTDQIMDRYKKAVFDNRPRDFLPEGRLVEIITDASVLEELWGEEDDPDDNKDQDLVDFILKVAIKLFAIALVSQVRGSKLRTAMEDFKATNYGDKDLPVTMDPTQKPSAFRSKLWKKLVYRNFLENQWIFIAPVFQEGRFKLDLAPEHIFPFIWVDNETKNGTFSEVFQVKIHELHQRNQSVQ